MEEIQALARTLGEVHLLVVQLQTWQLGHEKQDDAYHGESTRERTVLFDRTNQNAQEIRELQKWRSAVDSARETKARVASGRKWLIGLGVSLVVALIGGCSGIVGAALGAW